MSDKNRLESLLKQAITVQEDGLKKSSSDSRKYKSLILPNEMQVLLISDPKLENSAAALSVNVGSFSDPPELPGLAHFLEHMLFMGTEEYPKENDYSEFLSKNGGYSNAYTAAEHTNYFFQVMSNEFDGAIKRFSAFFKCPLLKEDATDRELKAVDNECSGNQQNDVWRSYLILRELAREDHPWHKFNIGNLKTLRDDPKEKGIEVRPELLKFYEKYYSANLMKLILCSNKSLDELTKMAETQFSSVVNKKLKTPYTSPHTSGQAFWYDPKDIKSCNLKKIVKAIPVKDLRRITLQWNLDKFSFNNLRREAGHYLAGLIGDEGEGSILSLLKAKGWANALGAGCGEDNFDFASFQVTIHCTDLGITKHAFDIIKIVYSYVNMMKVELPKPEYDYYFEETRVTSAIRYWFRSETRPMSLVTNLAAKMQQDYPIEEILVGDSLLHRDVATLARKMVNELVPEASIVILQWQGYKDEVDKEEEFFLTKYGVEPITDELADEWRNVKDFRKLGLKLTPPNPFIPSDFSFHEFVKPKPVKPSKKSSKFLKAATESNVFETVVNLNSAEVVDKVSVIKKTKERDITETWEVDSFRKPALIESDEVSNLWLKQDITFKKPKAIVKISVKTGVIAESYKAKKIASLYSSMVNDSLTEATYAAQYAGFSHSLAASSNGFVLVFYGFSETLHKYIELVTKKFKSFANEDISETLFRRFKERLVKGIKNAEKGRPVTLAAMSIGNAVDEASNTLERQFEVAMDLELTDVKKLAPTFFERVSLEVLVCGNATPKDAKNCLNIAKTVFKPTRPLNEHKYYRILDLTKVSDSKEGVQLIHVRPARDPNNPGSGLVVRFQLGKKTDEKTAILYAFGETCQEMFFNKLRTEQQVGYIVQAGPGVSNGVLSMNFYIESNTYDPIELGYRVEKFIDFVQEKFEDPTVEDAITEEVFSKLINAELNAVLKKSTTLAGESSRWSARIFNGLYGFDSTLKLGKALANITLDDMRAFLKKYLWKGAPKRAKFVSGILGEAHGVKLFGEDYSKTKPDPSTGFSRDFVMNWLNKDKKQTDEWLVGRGEILPVEDIVEFKKGGQYYPTYAEMLAAKL